MKNRNVLMPFFTGLVCLLFFSYSENKAKKVSEKIDLEKTDSVIVVNPTKTIEENKKVKEYFETLTLAVDEYANMIENLAETGKKMESTKEEPSLSDAFSMLSDITSSVSKMAPLLEKMEKLEKEADILKEDMSPQEIKEFSGVYSKIIARFYELEKKQNSIN